MGGVGNSSGGDAVENIIATGDEERSTAVISRVLGKQVQTFASKMERWNGKRAPPPKLTAKLTNSNRTQKKRVGEDHPPKLKRVRFLDNGEGKICEQIIPASEKQLLPPGEQMNSDELTKGDKVMGHRFEPTSPCESLVPPSHHINAYASVSHASRVPKACLPLGGGSLPRDTSMLIRSDETDGLRPPQLSDKNTPVTGCDKKKLRHENKCRRQQRQLQQTPESLWTQFRGDFFLPEDLPTVKEHRNQMCPSGLARLHPAGDLLSEWSQLGCPTMTGRPWTLAEMEAAITRGPHKSALSPEAMAHFAAEIKEKVKAGQARTVLWDEIRDDPPQQLKISPIAAVPHNSKPFRSILDLSFALKLSCGAIVPAVNDSTTKSAPHASVDQLGHALMRLICAFAEAGPMEKVFMAKWDVKDGFWRLDCEAGEEYNFAYVLPQPEGMPTTLVIPTSLQMGWIESPAYFCAASETSRDVAVDYAQTPMGSLPPHKFKQFIGGSDAYESLPECADDNSDLRFLVEVFVDDFMSLAIATSKEQLVHVGTGTMMGIHDVFPPCDIKHEDPVSEKKMEKGDSKFDTQKTLLGFDFDGESKTIWLEETKRSSLLLILKGWLRSSATTSYGIPFKIFESVVAKLRHAFTAIPAGLGLLSPCNKMLALKPTMIFLQRNPPLRTAITDIRTILKESIAAPTKCRELVDGWPHYIGYTDASGVGFGGIIFGETLELPPTVFRGQWPADVRDEIVSVANRNGRLSINDLEMAGLLLTFLVMEEVCPPLRELNVAMFSDNQPSVSWVERMASRQSEVGAQLLRALALRLKINRCCPLSPLHVAGKKNSMADVASRSFGTPSKWHCSSDVDFANLFNTLFPLPTQNTWTVFRPTNEICMRVISILRTQPSSLDEWRRIPLIGRPTGRTGVPTSNLWEWTRTYNTLITPSETECSPDSQLDVERDTTAGDEKSRLQQYLRLSRPLARRSRWSSTATH